MEYLDFHENIKLNCDFEFNGSQQFGTVSFDRKEDSEKTLITVIYKGNVRQFEGGNLFNPSGRRSSSCVYVKEECSNKCIKICTVQHKGITYLCVEKVSRDEVIYLFGEGPLEEYEEDNEAMNIPAPLTSTERGNLFGFGMEDPYLKPRRAK